MDVAECLDKPTLYPLPPWSLRQRQTNCSTIFLVFFSPNSSSRVTWQALGHDGERDPGTDLVGVVRAGDEVEEDGEGVVGREGDLAH